MKRLQTRVRTLAVLGLAVAVVAGMGYARHGQSGAVHAQSAGGCSNASLQGNYGYSYSGSMYLGADGMPAANGQTRLEISEVGTEVDDGQGNISVKGTQSVEGAISPDTGTGTYSINADCSGTVTFTTPDGPVHVAFVVTNGGAKGYFTGTDPGFSYTGTIKRQ